MSRLPKTQDQAKGAVPRLALRIDEAAASIGVSRDHFERHVLHSGGLPVVYAGRARLIPVRELERWLERQASSGAVRSG